MGSSSENLAKGLDYNFNYWNPATPHPTTTPITPQPPGNGNYYQQQNQQQQKYGHEPALSTSSTLHAVPSTPESQPNTRGANPSYSPKTSSNTNGTSNNNSTYNWHATNPNPSYSTNNNVSNDNNATAYNWHTTNPYPPYQPSTEVNRPLTPLQEEQSRTTSNNGVPSWTSEFDSELGVGRNASTLKRNASTRRESPTLGIGASWEEPHRPPVAARNTRERELLEREQEFEYDLPRTAGKSYFARLQALSGLSGYTVGNPFTSRM